MNLPHDKLPADASRRETALILFAHDEMWHSLQSIVWSQRNHNLDTLFVYHTEDNAAAAERLQRLCSKQWPELKVVIPGEAGSERPETLMERLRDWRAFRPNITDWVIDASGASPTMLAAISRAGKERPEWLIIAAGPAGEWQRWEAGSGGRLVQVVANSLPQSDEADNLDLLHLLPALCDTGPIEPQWRESRAATTLDFAHLAAIVAAGRTTNWDWQAMGKKVFGELPHAEWDFEDFIASTLLHLGAGSTRVRLPLKLQARRPCEQVIDVAAVVNGKLWLIDCQRRAECDPPLAFDNRIWLGLKAHRIVIRPERRGNQTELLLHDNQTLLLDGTACRNLFSNLGRALGVAVSAQLRDLERESLAIDIARQPLFSPATAAQQFSDAMRLATTIYDLPHGAAADNAAPPPWLAARLADDLWFLSGSLPQATPAVELRRRLANRLDSSRLQLEIVFFETDSTRRGWRALMRYRESEAALVKWLARWRNVPLVT